MLIDEIDKRQLIAMSEKRNAQPGLPGGKIVIVHTGD